AVSSIFPFFSFAAARHNDLRKLGCRLVTRDGVTNGDGANDAGANDADANGDDATNDDGASDGASPNDDDANVRASARAPAWPGQFRLASRLLIPHFRYARPEGLALQKPAPAARHSHLQRAQSGPLLFRSIQKQISVNRGVA